MKEQRMPGHTPWKEIKASRGPRTEESKRRGKAIAQAMIDAMALADLRTSRGRTQVQVAEGLGISQKRISQIEQAPNVYLTTLRAYVEELGGELELTAAFGDERVPIKIGGGLRPPARAAAKRASAA